MGIGNKVANNRSVGTRAAPRYSSPPPARTPPAGEGPAGPRRPGLPVRVPPVSPAIPCLLRALTQWGETCSGNRSSCQVTQEVGCPLLGKRGKTDSHQISSWRPQLRDPPPWGHMPCPLRGPGAPRTSAVRGQGSGDHARLYSMWDMSSPRFPPVAATGCCRGQLGARTEGERQGGPGPAFS